MRARGRATRARCSSARSHATADGRRGKRCRRDAGAARALRHGSGAERRATDLSSALADRGLPARTAGGVRRLPRRAGTGGVCTAGAVQLLDAGGAVIESSPDHRRSFRGLRKWRRWSPADALYFFGYALTHYQGLPFTLADARPLGLCEVRSAGQRLTGVDVELPATLHTHSRRQSFSSTTRACSAARLHRGHRRMEARGAHCGAIRAWAIDPARTPRRPPARPHDDADRALHAELASPRRLRDRAGIDAGVPVRPGS